MTFRWSDSSLVKLDYLADVFPEVLVPMLAEGLDEIAKEVVVPRARAQAARFEGDLSKDIGVWESPHVGGGLAAVRIGESGRLPPLSAGDSLKDQEPFSYALAKHDGAEGHKVYIYAKDGSSGSPARAKLRRYYSQFVGPLPDTQEGLNEQNRGKDRGERISPFMTVHPGNTARRFLADQVTGAGAIEIRRLLTIYLRRNVKRIWR